MSSTPLSFPTALHRVKNGESSSRLANDLLTSLTTAEALSLLDGDTPFWHGLTHDMLQGYNVRPYIHGSTPRLSIPGIRFSDGPRGATIDSGATIFPVSTARGATWDVGLEEKVGAAIGKEVRIKDCNFFAGVCINLPRHPAWGRYQETYSEDPLLLGEFGAALTRGAGKNVMTCVKHFALNSMENARFKVDVRIDEAALHEVYLPHFKRVVEEGVDAVMSSYNSVNGSWAGENMEFLTDILRGQWGFKGFVISDFIFGFRDSVKSLKNGLDVEAPFAQQRARDLRSALEEGRITMDDVRRSGERILAAQLEHYAKRDEEEPDPDLFFGKEHRALAREVAARSMVLLKNDMAETKALLPLAKNLSSCAVIGRLANTANTGDRGSSNIRNEAVVSPYQGISAVLPKTHIMLSDSESVAEAVSAAEKAEIAIVVVGYDSGDEGEYIIPSINENPELLKLFPPRPALEGDIKDQSSEPNIEIGAAKMGTGGDRASIRLRPRDVEIIHAVRAVNPRTIVTIVTAGPVIMEEWRHDVPAILISWYSASEGGHALADVLFGNVNVSGRLPYSIPRDEDHLPFFDREAQKIKYDRWWGQRLLDRKGVEAAFPIGFGLSYTSFDLSNLEVKQELGQEIILVNVGVKNTGHREGRCIVQVYGKLVRAGADFPSRVLLGFAPIDVEPAEAKIVEIQASTRPLQRWVEGKFEFASSKVVIEAGGCAGDPSALTSEVLLKGTASSRL